MKLKTTRSIPRTPQPKVTTQPKTHTTRWPLLGTAILLLLVVSSFVIWPHAYESIHRDSSYAFEPPTQENIAGRTRLIYSNAGTLFLADVEGKSKKELQLPSYQGYAASNDGTQVAYTTDKGDLVVTNVDGSSPRTIYQAKNNVSVRRVIAWSSNGEHILYEWEHRKSPPPDLDPAAPWCVKGECVDTTGYLVIRKDGSRSQAFKPQTEYEKWITESSNGNKFYDRSSKKIATVDPGISLTGQSASVSPNGSYRVISADKTSDTHSLFACDYYELSPDGQRGKLLISTHYDCSRIFWKDDHSFFFVKDTGPVPLEYALTSLATSYQPTAIALHDMTTARDEEILRSSDTAKDYFNLLGANGSHVIMERSYVKESMLSPARPSSLESIAVATKLAKVIDTPSNYPSLLDWVK